MQYFIESDTSIQSIQNIEEGNLKNTLGRKPFDYNQCPKTFSREDNLKSHLTTHSGEKPFPCNQCHKIFSGVGKLKKH